MPPLLDVAVFNVNRPQIWGVNIGECMLRARVVEGEERLSWVYLHMAANQIVSVCDGERAGEMVEGSVRTGPNGGIEVSLQRATKLASIGNATSLIPIHT